MRHPKTRANILLVLGKEIEKEMTKMSAKKTNSCFRQRHLAAMQIFTWDSLVSELESNALTLHQVLKACVTVSRSLRAQKRCGSKKNIRFHHPESAAVLGLCAAVLLRYHNHSMSLVQWILSVILHSGHAWKQVHVHGHVFLHEKETNKCTRPKQLVCCEGSHRPLGFQQ